MIETISFRERLEKFAQNPGEIDGPFGLKSVLTSMTPENLNQSSIQGLLQPSTLDVHAIVAATLEGKFLVNPQSKKSMQVFTDEATVLIFGIHGLPIGFYEMADGQVHKDHGAKEFGNTLLPYAGRKVGRARFLQAIGFNRGIRGIEATRSLKKIGPEGIDVFAGDAVVDLTPRNKLVIGVSGAQMTEEFLKFITGGQVVDHKLELFASMGDVILAEGVAERLRNPKLTVARIHSDFLQLATWH